MAVTRAPLKAVDPPDTTPAQEATAAFVDALGELTNPGRGSTARVQTKQGGSYSYAYASLDAVLALVRPVLARHGLALTQSVEAVPTGMVTVRTKLLHRRGGSIEGGVIARIVEGGPQELGSFVTYARRYQALALLGLHPEGEDDDGATAQQTARARRQDSGGSARGRDEPTASGPSEMTGEGQGASDSEGEGSPHPPPPPARNPIATSGPYSGFRFAVIARNPEGRKWLLQSDGGQSDANGDVAGQWAVWGEARADDQEVPPT